MSYSVTCQKHSSAYVYKNCFSYLKNSNGVFTGDRAFENKIFKLKMKKQSYTVETFK
jgi:hypothetical protein